MAQPGDPLAGAPLTGAKLALAAVSLALANFVVVLDTTIANVSVPHIAGSLAVSPTQGTWTITSYAVADAISVPLTGWLAARYGSVRWFILSLIGFGVFSLLCGLATSLPMLIAFRICQGFAGGPLMPLSQTLLLRIFPREKAGAGMAIWAMTTTSAPIIGPILGGYLSDNWSWHWIFFINLPVVAICVWAVARLIRRYETPTESRPIDAMGLALMVVSVGAFQVMLDIGREHDWFQSGVIVALAVVAAVTFAAFLIWELTEDHPIVDLRVFRHRGMTVGTLALALTFGTFFGSIVVTPLWLQQIVGYTSTASGQTVAWVGVLSLLLSPMAANLMGRIDLRITVFAGVVWLALVSLMRADWTTDAGYWTFALPQLLQGAGMPFFFIGLSTLALSSVTPAETVSAAGLMSFLRTLSGAIGTALATTAWDTTSTHARAEMVAHMNGVGETIAGLERAGLSGDQARKVIESMVTSQAFTVGLLNIYTTFALLFAVAAALVWLAPKPARLASGGGH